MNNICKYQREEELILYCSAACPSPLLDPAGFYCRLCSVSSQAIILTGLLKGYTVPVFSRELRLFVLGSPRILNLWKLILKCDKNDILLPIMPKQAFKSNNEIDIRVVRLKMIINIVFSYLSFFNQEFVLLYLYSQTKMVIHLKKKGSLV